MNDKSNDRDEGIYFDHNATTGVRPEVVEFMLPFFSQDFGNASSLHQFGQKTRKAVDLARSEVASLINAEPEEIFFTSGGTESDNIAIRGILSARGKSVEKPHIITSSIEHPAVLRTCRSLEAEGVEITYLPCLPSGAVDPSEVERAVKPSTVLVSIMFSNNETGVVQPFREISAIAAKHGIPFHIDAVQGVGKVPVDVAETGADLLSISAHKLYGPKGIGALYVRRGTAVDPVFTGGHQEKGLRPGTENIPAIAGFGEACRISASRLQEEMDHISGLRERLEKGLHERIEDIFINGAEAERVPNTTNVTITGIEGEALTLNLSMLGFALSSGSACATGDSGPSHVLVAMGLDPVDAQGSLRISLGIDNSKEDIDAFLDALPGVVKRLRDMSPITHRSAKKAGAGKEPGPSPFSKSPLRASGEGVVVGMSGGVDSSISAYILKESGYRVIGVTFRSLCTACAAGGTTGDSSVRQAADICRVLGIEHRVAETAEVFEEEVVREFIEEYRAGRTPNPCIRCNEKVKFPGLAAVADKLGIRRISTGHYARLVRVEGRTMLAAATDSTKDQSYFLYRVPVQLLKRSVFPLGGMKKKKVKEIASGLGLRPRIGRENQDICFLRDGGLDSFLTRHFRSTPGEVVDTDGRLLGHHRGIHHYTIGQRRGLGISGKSAMYVREIDIDKNRIILAPDSDLFTDEVECGSLRLRIREPGLPLDAKIRYRHKPAALVDLVRNGNILKVRFEQVQRAVTPGQSLVLLRGDLILGGGIISSSRESGR